MGNLSRGDINQHIGLTLPVQGDLAGRCGGNGQLGKPVSEFY